MEEISTSSVPVPESPACPKCHQPVPASAYFCANCGENLRPVPPDISVLTQIKVYAVSALLWPFGLIYVWKYYRQKDPKSQSVAKTALIVTIVMIPIIIWFTIVTINYMNAFNASLESALNGQAGL